ncbi:hypothetical protein KI387_005373, partial [Taxus chinensis]
ICFRYGVVALPARVTVTWSSSQAPSCKSIECRTYDIIEQAEGYEISCYNHTLWMSKNWISQNEEHAKVLMMTPMLTDILLSTGPFCESSFAVIFYMPGKFKKAPPKAEESLVLEQK